MTGFFRIYQQIVIANVGRTLAHRVDFWNSFVSSIMWGIFSIFAILALTTQSTQVMGWSRIELVFLSFSYAVVVGFFHLGFSRNFATAARIIHYGELDRYLLKPVSGLFLLSASELNFAQVGRIVLSIAACIWLQGRYDLPITVASSLSFVALTVFGVLLLITIHLLFVVLLLYQSSLSNIMEVGALLTSAARYPIDSLRLTPVYVSLLFLPVMAIVNIPTKALLGKAGPLEMVVFVVGSTLFFLTVLRLWSISISRYTGASG